MDDDGLFACVGIAVAIVLIALLIEFLKRAC